MHTRTSKIGVALLVWMLALVVWAFPALAEETVTAPDGYEVAAGSLIVTYEEAPVVTSDTVHADAVGVDGTFEEGFPAADAAIIEIPKAANGEGDDTAQLLAAQDELQAEPGVAAVDLDYIVQADFEPSDTEYRRGIQQELNTMKFPSAWSVTKGRNAVRVGVVDSGCDRGHPDLDSKIAADYDFVYDDEVANDPNGHGTHVAGSIAAETNNKQGMAAGGFYTKVVCARGLGPDGSGSISDLMSAVRYSKDKGAKVINNSWGGGGYVQGLADLIAAYHREGVLFVAAAGNGANDSGYRFGQLHYPSSYPYAFGVGAVDYQDRLAPFSERGAHVDVCAVGVDVLSLKTNGDAAGGGGYVYLSGTSMSSPQTSALAALLHTRGYVDAEAKAVRMRATADDLPPVGRDQYCGAGRINALRAVQK